MFPLGKILPSTLGLTRQSSRSVICVAALALALTACGPKRVEVRTVRVNVPVAVRCVEPADLKPLPPKPVAELPNDAALAMQTMALWLADLWPWAVEAEGQLRACAGD
jgi:hypothetical protein